MSGNDEEIPGTPAYAVSTTVPWGVRINPLGAGDEFGTDPCTKGNDAVVWRFAAAEEAERLQENGVVGTALTRGKTTRTQFETNPAGAIYNALQSMEEDTFSVDTDDDSPDQGLLIGLHVCMDDEGEVLGGEWEEDYPVYYRNGEGYTSDETVAYQVIKDYKIDVNEVPEVQEVVTPFEDLGSLSDYSKTVMDAGGPEKLREQSRQAAEEHAAAAEAGDEDDLTREEQRQREAKKAETAEEKAREEAESAAIDRQKMADEESGASEGETPSPGGPDPDIEEIAQTAMAEWDTDTYQDFSSSCLSEYDAGTCGEVWQRVKELKDDSGRPKKEPESEGETPPPDAPEDVAEPEPESPPPSESKPDPGPAPEPETPPPDEPEPEPEPAESTEGGITEPVFPGVDPGDGAPGKGRQRDEMEEVAGVEIEDAIRGALQEEMGDIEERVVDELAEMRFTGEISGTFEADVEGSFDRPGTSPSPDDGGGDEGKSSAGGDAASTPPEPADTEDDAVRQAVEKREPGQAEDESESEELTREEAIQQQFESRVERAAEEYDLSSWNAFQKGCQPDYSPKECGEIWQELKAQDRAPVESDGTEDDGRTADRWLGVSGTEAADVRSVLERGDELLAPEQWSNPVEVTGAFGEFTNVVTSAGKTWELWEPHPNGLDLRLVDPESGDVEASISQLSVRPSVVERAKSKFGSLGGGASSGGGGEADNPAVEGPDIEQAALSAMEDKGGTAGYSRELEQGDTFVITTPGCPACRKLKQSEAMKESLEEGLAEEVGPSDPDFDRMVDAIGLTSAPAVISWDEPSEGWEIHHADTRRPD